MNGSWADDELGALRGSGVAWLPGPFARPADAWGTAEALLDAVGGDEVSLEVIGDYVLPPADAAPSRDFQTLHFDFGLPLVPVLPVDVACFTGLHVPASVPTSDATTRLVPLRPLLAERPWPTLDELLERFAAYARSHGARDGDAGYVEGSLARIVEAALGSPPVLPSVRAGDGFLCGTEFTSSDAEARFFAQRGLRPEAVEMAVSLNPGELLLFDNLRLAHGRRGTRSPGELRQRVFGHRKLSPDAQIEIRNHVLAAFGSGIAA